MNVRLDKSNIKWIPILGLILSFFIYAMAQSKADGKQEEKVDTNTVVIQQLIKADEKTVEFRVVQVAQIARLEETSKNTAEDVKEIKDDNKEMLKILLEINNK